MKLVTQKRFSQKLSQGKGNNKEGFKIFTFAEIREFMEEWMVCIFFNQFLYTRYSFSFFSSLLDQ